MILERRNVCSLEDETRVCNAHEVYGLVACSFCRYSHKTIDMLRIFSLDHTHREYTSVCVAEVQGKGTLYCIDVKHRSEIPLPNEIVVIDGKTVKVYYTDYPPGHGKIANVLRGDVIINERETS